MRRYQIDVRSFKNEILSTTATVYNIVNDVVDTIGSIRLIHELYGSIRTTPISGQAIQPAGISADDRDILDGMLIELYNGTVSGTRYVKDIE